MRERDDADEVLGDLGLSLQCQGVEVLLQPVVVHLDTNGEARMSVSWARGLDAGRRGKAGTDLGMSALASSASIGHRLINCTCSKYSNSPSP